LNRRALYIGIGIAAAAGLFLGWDWLVAVGAASIIIAIAPCLIMCALGLCMNRACRDKKTDVLGKAGAGDVEAPTIATTAGHDAPVTNSVPPRVAAPKAAPDAEVERTAAAQVADANMPSGHSMNAPAPQRRA
jgi:hypothetical protein